MPEKEERTFYSYNDGYSPQELSLGHLVIGTYVRPTTGRQCSIEPLSEAELNTWSIVQPRSNVCFSSSSLRGFGISVTALDLMKARVSVNQENHHVVASEHCRRITLKNGKRASPKQFLSEKVLAVDSTRKAVQEWLSVSNHEYALRQLTSRGWWPKIWMLTGILTGIYAFEDCTSFAWRKNDMSVEANVAAEIMELLNIPVDVTVRATNSGALYSRQTFDVVPFSMLNHNSSIPTDLANSLLNQPMPMHFQQPNFHAPSAEVKSRKENRLQTQAGPSPSTLSNSSVPGQDHMEMRRVSQQMFIPPGSSLPVCTVSPRVNSPPPSMGGELSACVNNLSTNDAPLAAASGNSLDRGTKRLRNFTPASARAIDDEDEPRRAWH